MDLKDVERIGIGYLGLPSGGGGDGVLFALDGKAQGNTGRRRCGHGICCEKGKFEEGWQERNLLSQRRTVLSTRQLQGGLGAGVMGSLKIEDDKTEPGSSLKGKSPQAVHPS